MTVGELQVRLAKLDPGMEVFVFRGLTYDREPWMATGRYYPKDGRITRPDPTGQKARWVKELEASGAESVPAVVL